MHFHSFKGNVLFLLCFISFTAQAQRSAFDIGFGYQLYNAEGVTLRQDYGSTKIDTGISYREGGAMLSGTVGKSIILWRVRKFALAVNPSLSFAGGEVVRQQRHLSQSSRL